MNILLLSFLTSFFNMNSSSVMQVSCEVVRTEEVKTSEIVYQIFGSHYSPGLSVTYQERAKKKSKQEAPKPRVTIVDDVVYVDF